MTDASEWTGRVGNAWAEEWRRTDRSFGALTDRLVDVDTLGSFASVLDIGCGAGEVSLRIAEANPHVRVLGIDISAELVATAQVRGEDVRNARFVEADAASWLASSDAQPDLLVSRHGVMFFPDPVAAFAHLREQSAPQARLRFSCFRARGDNAWASALASVLPPQLPANADAPGPFAFADPERVESLLASAGWHDVAFEPIDYAMIAGEGRDAVDEALAYFQRIGPAARALADMPTDARDSARERLRAMLAAHCEGERVSLSAASWIVTARSQ